ncbi:type IV pili methyl-accepting chemotaxis transducer N-terminal domain-containing protein [Wenyingzhuangia sp. IMCC45533]
MKKLVLSITLLATFISNAQTISKSEFINTAGKQRMLSQKIAKNYLVMSFDEKDIDFKASSKVLIDFKIASSIFQRNLEVLKKNLEAYNKDLLKVLDKEESKWKEFSEATKKPKTPENAIKVLELSSELLKVSNDVVIESEAQFLQSSNDKDLIKLVNKSGKQRMLSQRLALLFTYQKLEKYIGKKQRIKTLDLDAVFDKMDSDIGELMVSEYNSAAKTDDIIGEISVEFDILKSKRSDFVEGNIDLNEVIEVTNNLTRLFNDLTFAYSKIEK